MTRRHTLEDLNFLMLLKYRYVHNINHITVISDFRREVDEICTLLGNYAEYSGNNLPTIRGRITTVGSVISQKSAVSIVEVWTVKSLCRGQV